MINNILAFADVMKAIGGVAIAILVLLLTITVHEFGHYLVGKLLKFKINEFAIGMGPAVFKKKLKNGEVFSIRIFPLGGYCAFEGEDDAGAPGREKEKSPDKPVFDDYSAKTEAVGDGVLPQKAAEEELSENAFNNKKPWQRILVLIAGGATNIFFAIIIIAVTFSVYGHFTLVPTEIMPSDVAVEQAYSLESGDKIIEIDGKYVYLATDFIDALKGKKKGDMVKVVVDNDGKRFTREVSLRCDVESRSMTDFFDGYDALGVATNVITITEEGSPFIDSARIVSLADGTKIYTLTDLYGHLSKLSSGDTIAFKVIDGGVEKIHEVTIPEGFEAVNIEYETKEDQNVAFKKFFKISAYHLVYSITSENVKMGFFEGVYRAPLYGLKTMWMTIRSLAGLFNGTVKISDVSGPVGTISITSQYVSLGLNYALEIMALIGISIGVFNLLPLPALDGGRIVFVIIEWIRGKPINRKVEGMIHMIGLFVLLAFAIIVDLLKLF
ncbi:MAG: site-2 protease family protein [Clostridia bacterium]|nr:site-2 protease family protein [Clostridia bacterium]